MNDNEVFALTGELAVKLAKVWNLPHNENCRFEFELNGERKWIGYDSGWDYDKDGGTYETEWPLPNNLKESIMFLDIVK
jgi:hypothetical protein